MNQLSEMNEDSVLETVRSSVHRAAPGPPPPLAAVVARGRSRRRHRVAGVSLATTAAAAAVAMGVAGVAGSPGPSSPAGRSPAQLAAFTLTSNPDGTTTLAIPPRELLNPGTLRQALATHGIPALVTEGSFCTSSPEPAGFGQVVVPERPRPSTGPKDQVLITIDGAAIPAGAELSIGYFDGDLQRATVTLVSKDAYACSTARPTAPDPQGGLMLGALARGSGLPRGSQPRGQAFHRSGGGTGVIKGGSGPVKAGSGG